MRILLSLGLLFSVFASAQVVPTKTPLPKFEDVAKQAGLTVSHISSPEKRYIVESMSGGLGLIDCDNDGRLDIITVNGSTVDRYKQGGDPMITLYHQDDGFEFTDITKSAGLTRKGWGMGVAVADYDNDGLPDIYVTGYGGNALYHNLGNCKFEDVTDKAGVAAGGFSTGAAWADYDRDGRVDLFVSRYVHFDVNHLPDFGKNEKNCSFKGIPVQCGPWGMLGESDLLFHNRGDGTFEEVSKKAGVDDPDKYYGGSLKLKPGVTVAQANAELQPLLEQFAKETPKRYPDTFRVNLRSIVEIYARPLGPILYLLLGAVGSLLLIGCARSPSMSTWASRIFSAPARRCGAHWNRAARIP